MTNDEEYAQYIEEIETVFGERRAINKRLLKTCENKLTSSLPSENPTKWIIGKLAFQELDDVWDNLQKINTAMVNTAQNLEHRIKALEDSAIELGAKITREDLITAVNFAGDFKVRTEEIKRQNAEYKRKMEENDLAT